MRDIPQVRNIEMGAAAFVQHASIAIAAAMLAARHDDPVLFPPDERKHPDWSDPEIDRDHLKRICEISVQGAEALLRAYGPIGFIEEGSTKPWQHGPTDARVRG
jgi:hypothetical protein